MLKIGRIVLVAVLAAGLLGMAGVKLSRAAASSIGYIDVKKVFSDYKETAKAQSEISKEEESFKKELEGRQKKVEDAKKAGKAEKEITDLTKKFEEELTPQREKLLKLNEALTVKLQGEIVKAVQETAKTLGIDVVVDKQVIITGGMDLTEMVINRLNQGK